MKVIQELVAYFERRGRLTRTADPEAARPGAARRGCPANMVDLCDPVGATFYFRVAGDTIGTVWGTDIYTGDSVALRRPPSTPASSSPARPPSSRSPSCSRLGQYQGSVRNGVTSRDFGQYGTAYRLAAV